MSEGTAIKVLFNGDNFEFWIVDSLGQTHEFTLHTVGTIELIQEMKRETREKITHQQLSMRPLLRLLRGGEC